MAKSAGKVRRRIDDRDWTLYTIQTKDAQPRNLKENIELRRKLSTPARQLSGKR